MNTVAKMFARLIIYLLLVISTIQQLWAQVTISTVPLVRHRANNQFTADWLYLSTDLYLYNTNKFDFLINQLRSEQEKQDKKKRKKGKDVDIENLVISINMKALLGRDMIYPIYSFLIKNEKDKASSQISGGYEVVRIIKDLPLQQSTDELSAEIKAEIFGKEDEDKMLKQVSDLLKNAEKLNNPPAAVLSMVAELGNFIESTLNQKQFVYSNTIRLYDETPFNRKLHSINVFQFVPSSLESGSNDNSKLLNALDTLTAENLNRQTLEKILNLSTYPYLVVVNYKSKYLAEQITGDEIDYKYIENRRQKAITRYTSKEIPEEIYQQEMALMDFLVLFVDFKNDIQQYELNYKSKVVDDFSQSFFRIMQRYRFLKNAYAMRLKSYANTPVFSDQYKTEYDKIGFNAEVYLQSNIHLRNIGNLVNTLYMLEHERAMNQDSALREDYLRKLYAVQLPAGESNSEEVRAVNFAISQLENSHLQKEFIPEIKYLDGIKFTGQTNTNAELLIQTIRNTNCQICRDSAALAVNRYLVRKEARLLAQATDSLARRQANWNIRFFFLMKKRNCFQTAFDTQYPADAVLPAHIAHLQKNSERMHTNLLQLEKMLGQSCTTCTSQQIWDFIFETDTRMKTIENEMNTLCDLMPQWCNCN